jgi:hypothetical protein
MRIILGVLDAGRRLGPLARRAGFDPSHAGRRFRLHAG